MVYLCASGSAPFGSAFGPRGRTRGEESWNWSSNATVLVHCYTTCSEVQLTLNGKVVGTKRRADAVQGELTWSVPFEPLTWYRNLPDACSQGNSVAPLELYGDPASGVRAPVIALNANAAIDGAGGDGVPGGAASAR